MRVLAALSLLVLTACGQQATPTIAPAPIALSAPAEAPTALAAIAPAPADRIGIIIELLPSDARAPHDGGSGAILLADPASALSAEKNAALCRAAFAASTTAAATEPMRPIYWLARETVTALPSEDPCPARLEAYDYPRALALKKKLGLGDGPFLIAERADRGPQRVALVLDLSRTRAAEIAEALRFFRDDLAQGASVWDPRGFAPDLAAERARRFFNAAPPFRAAPRLIEARRNVGCPVEDLLDRCAT